MISEKILEIQKQLLEKIQSSKQTFEDSVNENIKQTEEMLRQVIDPILKKFQQFEIEMQKIQEVQLDDTDIVKMNVGGTTYITQRSVLTQVKDSVMEAMFSGRHPLKEVDGVMFLDKNPKTFKHVLEYLRCNQKMIDIESQSTKKLVEIELEWWGLPPMGYKEKLEDLQNIFDSEPPVSGAPLTNWKELGQLNLQELIKNGDIKFDHSLDIVSINGYQGQVNGQKELHGIGRQQWISGSFYDGEQQNDKRNGFGRDFWSYGDYYVGEYKDDYKHGQGKEVYQDGGYYVGQWKDGDRHGQGKMVNQDGSVEEGKWEDDEFVSK